MMQQVNICLRNPNRQITIVKCLPNKRSLINPSEREREREREKRKRAGKV
jgi:hypothetical protein